MSDAGLRHGRAAIFLLALASSAASLVACTPPPPPAPRAELAPSWVDALGGMPELYVVLRPQALKRDAVYGSFWRALVRAATARGFARGATMLEAVEGAGEIAVGLHRGDDAVIALRGVPARLDPQTITDDKGRPLFRALDGRAKVVEYEPTDASVTGGALFVLPDRSWVGTLGRARSRARRAFARPTGRRAPDVGGRALAAIHLEGPLARVLAARAIGALGERADGRPMARELVTATLSLEPGKGGVVAALAYANEPAAAAAEARAKRLVSALSKEERFAWIAGAAVERRGRVAFVRVAVPARLLEDLPMATGGDLPLGAP